MNLQEICLERISNLGISTDSGNTPEEAVSNLCSLQAQDYRSSLWAIGLRCSPGTTVADVEEYIERRRIVRSWLNRGTIHFSAAQDVKWQISLYSPGLRKTAEIRDGHLGLTPDSIERMMVVLKDHLTSAGVSTRSEMYEVMEANNAKPRKGNLGYHLLYRAAWDGLICFGPQDENEQTFTLQDSWIEWSEEKSRDESLASLAERYFRSHGPATLQDFAWWSGLKMTEAREGLKLSSRLMESFELDGKTYYRASGNNGRHDNSGRVFLLPAFDEYIVGYTDRAWLFHGNRQDDVIKRNGIFLPTIVSDGFVIGTWRQKHVSGGISLNTTLFRELEKDEKNGLKEAAEIYGSFLGKDIKVNI